MNRDRPVCPNCGSSRTVGNGSFKCKAKQGSKYFCISCCKSFSTFTSTIFWFGHYKPSVVLTAVEFRERYRLSSREIERIFSEKFGTIVPNSTVCDWVNRFAEHLPELREKFKPDFSQVWHVDEVFLRHEVRHQGTKKVFFDYAWIAWDEHLNVLAVHVSKNRDYANAKIVLQKAKEYAGFSPRILVTDGLQAYNKACWVIFGKKTLHQTSHFKAEQFFWDDRFWLLSNNRAEHGNTFIRAFQRSLKGYKSLPTGQRLLELFGWFFNYRNAANLAAAMLAALVPRA